MGKRLFLHLTVNCFTTPAELRSIADQMEAHWQQAAAGSSLKVDKLISEEAEVVFVCDQEAMVREYGMPPIRKRRDAA